jgi:hypothetical protein
MKKLSFSAAAICLTILTLTGAKAQSASTITLWNFEPLTSGINNSPAPSTGSGTATSLGMDIYATPNVGVNGADVTLGKANDTGSSGVTNTTLTWRVRGVAGTNGAANGWSSAAPIGTQGAQFNVATTGFSSINVSFDWYVTSAGAANLQFQYSTNGSSWINTALALNGSANGLVSTNNSSSTNTVNGYYVRGLVGQNWFTGLTATISDENAANNANFGFRLVNASTGVDCVSATNGALGNSGNWRFDNVTVSGTAVPEPAAYALLGLGALVLILAGRRKHA